MLSDSDSLLLRKYSVDRDEVAFAELVRRRLDGVYAFVLRRVGGDAHLAQDIAQQVFVALARQARRVGQHSDLTGWLYTTARHLAANAVRAERRRKLREEKGLIMSENPPSPEIDWKRIAPVLDDAIEQLAPVDRAAIHLRFTERRAFADIGATLQVSEDAARMRVERALEKLRDRLVRRGIVSSSALIGAALASEPLLAVPSSLALNITTAALAAGINSSALLPLGGLFAMSKLTLGLTAGLALAATLAFREVRASRALGDEITLLQHRNSDVAGLQVANTRLVTSLAAAGVNPDAAELARVHARIAVLQARPDGVIDAAMKPVAAFANRGWATPAAAFETQIWARTQGDLDEFSNAFGWTENSKAKIDRFFAALPVDVRTRYGTPERMLAQDAAQWGPIGTPVAIQLIGQIDYGDKFLIHAWGSFSTGKEVNMNMLLQRIDDAWRVPFTEQMTDRLIASLDPRTGERRLAGK